MTIVKLSRAPSQLHLLLCAGTLHLLRGHLMPACSRRLGAAFVASHLITCYLTPDNVLLGSNVRRIVQNYHDSMAVIVYWLP